MHFYNTTNSSQLLWRPLKGTYVREAILKLIRANLISNAVQTMCRTDAQSKLFSRFKVDKENKETR